MNKWRDLIVLSLTAAAFVASLVMFRRAVGIASPWFGVVAMLSILGTAAIARPLFLLKLPGVLRKSRKWEASGGLYKAVGVQGFGAVLRRTPVRYLNQFVYMSRCATPSALQAQIESAEAAHVLAAGLLIPYVVYACVQRWWGALVSLVIVDVACNIYPILHLRWTRARLDRSQERRSSRTRTAHGRR